MFCVLIKEEESAEGRYRLFKHINGPNSVVEYE